MARLCYKCHLWIEHPTISVAEDAQQLGLEAARMGADDRAVELYRQARELILEVGRQVHGFCLQHIPPMFCAAEQDQWPGERVWLPSMFGTYVLKCESCGQFRPCIDCNRKT